MEKPARPPYTESPEGYPVGIMEAAARLNREYMPWDTLRVRELARYSALELWRAMALLRRGTRSTVSVGGSEFSWNVTPGMLNSLHELDMKHTGGRVFGHKLNRHSRRAFAVSSAMEEAVGSALISGCMIQAKSVKKHIREDRDPKNEYERIAMNTYRLLGFARSKADSELTPGLLEEMNRVATGLEEVSRTEMPFLPEAHTREPDLTAFPPEKIKKAVSDVCAFARNGSVHPLVRAFGIEYMILRIQPFRTGNGRTARAAASWCLARNGYEIDEFLSISGIRRSTQATYQKAFMLSEAEGDDMTYAISFGLEAMVSAVSAFLAYIDRKARETDDILTGMSLADLNIRQRAVLSDLVKTGNGMTVEEVASKHQVSYQTARSDLLLLLTRGLVVKGARDGHKDTYIVPGKDAET